MYILFMSKGHFLTSLTGGLLSGPPMALGMYAFIFYIAPATKRLPFLPAAFIQLVCVLAMLVVSFTLGSVGIGSVLQGSNPLSAQAWRDGLLFWTNPNVKTPFIVTTISIFGLLLVWQLMRKLGPGVLGNWLSGYYHQPREEERIFMFLDIRNSTTLAEQMGHLKFSGMIQEFFGDMTTPIMECQGAVSHYIGDEAVLTWKPKDGLKDANCLRFFYRMKEEIDSRSAVYREKFGIVPEFKAGVHYGQVVACEVGYVKSEVVYLGDVLNTTARIQGLCDKLEAPLLVSAELASQLLDHPGLSLDNRGAQELKGKAEPITVLAVSQSA